MASSFSYFPRIPGGFFGARRRCPAWWCMYFLLRKKAKKTAFFLQKKLDFYQLLRGLKASKKQKQGVCMLKKVLAKVLYFLLFLCVIGCPAWRGWVWKKLFY